MNKIFKMVYISILVAQALVLFIVESMIPVPFITPGAKLGLANLITVIALYTLDNEIEVFLVVLMRLIMSTIIGSNLSAFMYSAAGAVLSYCMMILIKRIGKDKLSIIGVSATGATFHNVGQLLMASAVVKNINVMLYLPVLTFVGIGTGIFIGITANYAVIHMSKINYFNKVLKIQKIKDN